VPIPKKNLETMEEERPCPGWHRALTELGWGDKTPEFKAFVHSSAT